jgi:MYXO-CTERM domain-containing protein
MFRAQWPWLWRCLWAAAALGFLSCAEALEQGVSPDAVPSLTLAVTVDTEAPDTTLTSQPPNPSNSTSATFAFTATEAGASFECRLDTSPFATCPSPITFTSLSAGSHTFQARAKDAAGNIDPTPASYTWTIDRIAPETIITAQPPNPSNSTSATFTFTSNEAAVTFECKLDTAAAFTSCTSPTSFADLAAGSHTFQVRARDAAGNLDASPASYTWFVDTTPPNTFITSSPPSSSSATITFTSNEAPVSFECKLDEATFSSCSSPATLSNLPDGSHTFQVRARDSAGNIDPTPASITWTVDTTAPDTTLTGGPADPANTPNATFTFTSNDSTASYECKLDAGTFTACTSPASYTNLTETRHTFSVRAKDPVGNIDPTPASASWVVDVTAPDTTLQDRPPALSNSPSATFTFTSEAGASFECKLDAGAFAPCPSPTMYAALADGSHTFQVRARDTAGNFDPSPDTYTWTVDTTAPATTIHSQPPSSTNSTSATFTFSSDDPTATFECRLNAESLTPCTSPKTYEGMEEGSHTFEVRARDTAGNVDDSPADYTWVIDRTAPDTFITSPPPSSPRDTITFTSNETPVTFACSLDGNAFTPCTSPVRPSNLSDGSHTFQVRAMDAAGNEDTTPATLSWTVDTTPPDTTLTSQPPTSTRETSARFTFSSEEGAAFECSLDEAPFETCTSPAHYVELIEDVHTFQVRAKDMAGNVDPTPASHTWTVDLTAPDTTLVLTPADPSHTASATFSFTSTKSDVDFECKRDDALAFSPCTSPVEYTGLTEGPHTFQVRAVDAAGNTDATPASFTWVVDARPPEAPVIQSPTEGSTITQRQPPISGMAQPESIVTLVLDDAPFETTTADSLGQWMITPASQLSFGPHTLSATAQDGAGTSVASEPVSFTIEDSGGLDGGLDAGPDGGLDAGPDGSADGGLDGGLDAGPDGGNEDPDNGGCACGAASTDASVLLWGLGLLAALAARRRTRPTLNHP